MKTYWCHNCKAWQYTEVDYFKIRYCSECGDPIPCDECGQEWTHDHRCPT